MHFGIPKRGRSVIVIFATIKMFKNKFNHASSFTSSIYSGQMSLVYAKELKQTFYGNFKAEENAN